MAAPVSFSRWIRLMASMVTGRSLSPGKTGSRDCSRSQRGSFRVIGHRQPRCGIRPARHHGGHDMRFYNQAHRFYCGVDLHARSLYIHVLDAAGQTVLDGTCPPRPPPSSTPSSPSATASSSVRVHVRLVLAGRPVRDRTHPLRPRPRPVHEDHPRRQGQERPDRRRQARRPAPRRPVPDGLRLPEGQAADPRPVAPPQLLRPPAGPTDRPHLNTNSQYNLPPFARSSPTPATARPTSPSASSTRARSSPSPPTWP